MSDAIRNEPAGINASEIDRHAAAWLEQRVSGNWAQADQAAFDAWRAELPAHEVAFLRLESAWRYADRLVALRAPEPAPLKPVWPMFLRMAAGFVLVAVLGVAAARYFWQPGERIFSTSVGGREVVSFADGSKIELNTDTVLRADMTTDQRTVWLDKGEAFFQVKHDAAHPFVVMVGDHRVTDLGTKFLIRRDPGRLEVALLEGSIRFGAADARKKSPSALLAPNDTVTSTGSTMFVTKETPADIAKELSWRHGLLVFKHTTLADAANEFNRYNRQKLLIADPAVAQLRIYGTFQTNNVRVFTDVAREIFGLHVENDGDEIVISR